MLLDEGVDGVVSESRLYFFNNEDEDDDGGVERESSPYFFPKNDFVVGVVVGVVCVSAYFFISSERLPVDGDGVDKPSSPYFL